MIRMIASIMLAGFLTGGCLGEAGDHGATTTVMQQPTPTTVEGTLEVLVADERSGARYWFFLQTDSGVLKLRFRSGMATHVRTGDRVRVRGVRVGADELVVDGPADVQPVR